MSSGLCNYSVKELSPFYTSYSDPPIRASHVIIVDRCSSSQAAIIRERHNVIPSKVQSYKLDKAISSLLYFRFTCYAWGKLRREARCDHHRCPLSNKLFLIANLIVVPP